MSTLSELLPSVVSAATQLAGSDTLSSSQVSWTGGRDPSDRQVTLAVMLANNSLNSELICTDKGLTG